MANLERFSLLIRSGCVRHNFATRLGDDTECRGRHSHGGPWKRASALLAGVALYFTLAAWSDYSRGQTAPTTTSKAKPKSNDLLKTAPFDRITLTDNAVFEIEPLSPRPLPPIDKKKKSLADLEDSPDKPKSKRKDAFERKDDGEGEQMVTIHLLEGEPRDFKTKRSSIKDVEYFEDMLLVEADRMIKEGDYTKSFERLQFVKVRDPNWRGLEERVNRLLFEEGIASLIEDNARGLRLLTDLHSRKPDYPGLADRLAGSYATRIGRALAVGDYSTCRRLVREVDIIAPGHPEALAVRGRHHRQIQGLNRSGREIEPVGPR